MVVSFCDRSCSDSQTVCANNQLPQFSFGLDLVLVLLKCETSLSNAKRSTDLLSDDVPNDTYAMLV